jgi:predicted PurR-regulated permease PerM
VEKSRLWRPATRWSEFRRRQLAALEESNRIAARVHGDPRPTAAEAGAEGASGGTLGADAVGPTGDGPFGAPVTDRPQQNDRTAFGVVGRPLNRHSPFYLGFVGALGAVLAIALWGLLGRLTTTLTILVVSVFLSLALDPVVQWLTGRGLRRPGAVVLTFAGLIAVFGLIGLVVIPPVVSEASELATNAPEYLQQVIDSRWVRQLDREYDLVNRLQEEVEKRATDQGFISGVLGGVLGAGRAVLNGFFQVFTVLVLTLYFLAALPRIKHSAYATVPASRRTRVSTLSEEIMRRTGSYALGQVAVASLNGALSWVMMTIVGIPYAAVLAVTVGLLGLIPMVGATLGAFLVCVIALFTDPTKALIAAIYYLVYQQLENYVIAPRIMQRTVSVPGAVTVVAALAGGTLFGVIGALLAILVAAGLLLLYEEVLVPRQERA